MKMLTKEILKSLPRLRSQDGVADPMVQVKFFCPWNQWTWFGIEYDPEERLFFGYVVGNFNEMGYFSLDELESIRNGWGMKIERDLHFTPKPLSQTLKDHNVIRI